MIKKCVIAKSTECGVKKKADNIKSMVVLTFGGTGNQKFLKKTEFPRMERVLYKWFLQQIKRNASISDGILKEKVKCVLNKVKEDQSAFTVSYKILEDGMGYDFQQYLAKNYFSTLAGFCISTETGKLNERTGVRPHSVI